MQVVKVTTAIELTAAQQTKIEKTLSQKAVGEIAQFEYVVDPHVLGGIKIAFGSRELDGTLRTKLEQIHERLTANA